MDWLDLLAVQGTLQESSPTLQFKSINSLVLSRLHSPGDINIDALAQPTDQPLPPPIQEPAHPPMGSEQGHL